MPHSALILDDTIQKHIDQAVERASLHVMPISTEMRQQLKDAGLMENMVEPEGKTIELKDRPEDWRRTIASEMVEIPIGYRAAISFEEQPAPLGVCKHLSVTWHENQPPDFAFVMIARAFGMLGGIDKPRKAWKEEFEPGRFAMNLVEPVEWKEP